MKKKVRKYNLFRVARVLGVMGIIVILYFSIQLKSNSNIKRVNIVLESINPEKLISKTDILKYLNKSLNKDLEIAKIEKIDIGKIEILLDKSRFIKNSDVFIDSKNNLHINCKLRDPIVRISRQNAKDYYLDISGFAIPISKRSTARVPIINGYLKDFKIGDLNKTGTTFNNIMGLLKKIHSDPFLKALVEQIHIEEGNRLTIIPKLGRQKIEFGGLEKVDDKLAKIKTFYKSGVPGVGWNKFEKLSVEWEGQLVITKSN